MTESEKKIRKALADIDIQNTHLGVEMATSNLKLVCTKTSITELLAQLDAKQAKIDELMFEYCQEDMTRDQVDEWCKRQRAVSPERQRKINAALQQEQNNGL
jgi:hypothetical protein